ncbi:hypothetical protein JZ751_010051 [Albula glossodonta]|uniref:Insulin-like growth factor-binding protein 1 n=1 Tax=Albula glossodonta TaxID=121402 RepID=A0A8T2N135_9TELE|nr:hypothetical protein JZ751_010051 [Albula glossodonta]
MMSWLRLLCLAALSLFTRPAEAVGPVVRCEPCDVASTSLCKPVPSDCAERVREPGCGCCMTCALAEGESCGIYTRRCGTGLTCLHRPGETKPLLALLEGRGRCSGSTSDNGNGFSVEDNTTVVDRSASGSGAQDEDGQQRVPNPKVAALHPRSEAIRKDQSEKSQRYKGKPLSVGVSADVQNLSFKSKEEGEYGPCRREMESVLKSLKFAAVINPQSLCIPNCDKKGFYKKKQCRPSRGRRRGHCWCVDRYGKPLPGLSGKEGGGPQCFNLENQ